MPVMATVALARVALSASLSVMPLSIATGVLVTLAPSVKAAAPPLVVATTFPLALPFLLMDQVGPAMRMSNAIALAMLFLTGVVHARGIGRPPLRMGLGMVALGVVLVVLTIALGG